MSLSSPGVLYLGTHNLAILDSTFYSEFSLFSKHKKQANSTTKT